MGDFDDINVKINVDASGAEQGITRVSTSLNKLNTDVGKLGTGADFGDKLNSESKQAEGGLDKLGEAAEQANQKLAKVGTGLNLSAVGSQLDALSGKMKAWGAGLSILAAPFELVGAASVNAFADFEKGIGKINTLLPDATKAEMEAVGEQLKAFSSEFGADINDAIQAYYDALSAGVAQGDVLPFMETAQKAGVAGMSDVSVAVDGLTSILNSYQKKTSEAENVSDVMFKTVELGKIEFEQLAANIGKVAPTAAQFKIGFEDVGAAIASITSQGLKPEQTMTVLTSLISQLGKSGTDLSDKFKEITGQSFPDFIASGGTLADAIGKIRDYSQDTGTSLMDMTGNLEAAKGLAMLGGSAFDQYAGFLDKLSDSAGATDTAYSKMSETMAFAMDQLKAQMQTTMIEVGDALAPVVKDFTQWLSENSDEISDFAVSIAQNAVPAIEKLFDILKGLMDLFNNLPGDTKSILGQLLGVGAVGAAIGGPALFAAGSMGTAISSVMKLASYMGKLVIPATVAGDITAIGTAASGAAGASGVGSLSAALAAIGGPVTLGAIAGVGLAIVAWETDFMGVKTTALDSAEAIFAGFQNVVSSSLEFIGGAAPAISEAFWGALSDPDYKSQLIPNLQAVFAKATDTVELEGRAAASAWIDNWNSEIASGRIKAPEIPDSQTASRTNTGINEPYPYPDGMYYVNGSFQPIVYAEGAAQYAEEQKKLNSLFAQFPTQQALASQQGTQTGAQAGTEAGAEAGAPVIAEQTGKSVAEQLAIDRMMYDRGQLDIAAAERLLEKAPQLADKYKQNTPAGTASDPLVVTTTTPTGSTPAASTPSPGTFERPSGNIPDLFTRDPAKYVEQELKSILNGGFDGSIAAYEDYLSEFGMDLEDKGKQIFEAAKSKGFGGSVDWSDWWSEAQAGLPISIASLQNSFKGLESVFQTLEKTISDGSASSSEAERYLDEYNKSTGKTIEYTERQTSQTKDLMNAYSSISNAQDLYNKYMDDGKLSTEEATAVQAALAQGIDLMGTAGADTADKIANMPSALKDLASAVSDFLNNIKSSVNSAMQDTLSDEGWKLATTDKYETIGESSKTDLGKYFGLDSAGNTIDQFSQSTRDLTGIYDKANESTTMLNSTIELTPSAIDILTESTSAMASTLVAKAQELNAAVVAAKSRAQRSYDESNRAWNPFGSTPSGWRDPSPCGWGVAFESGGPVTSTGPAMVHQGEMILSRNDVRNMSKQRGNEVKLTVDMRNSRFGNADLATDLPRKIAQATKRVLTAGGL